MHASFASALSAALLGVTLLAVTTVTAASTASATGDPVDGLASMPTATASSSAPGTSPDALVDGGQIHTGDTGFVWTAAGTGAQWVQIRWPSARTIDTIQLYGNSAISGATLTFANGTTVPVPAITAGGAPTQVEFDSRKVSWVRLDIPAGSTPASLREMAVFLAWGTAPTWIGGSAGVTTSGGTATTDDAVVVTADATDDAVVTDTGSTTSSSGTTTSSTTSSSTSSSNTTSSNTTSGGTTTTATVTTGAAATGDPVDGLASMPTATASSSASGTSPDALVDGGQIHTGDTGYVWTAAGTGAQWVQIRWPSARTIDTIQLYGNSALSGATLTFANGTTIAVPAVTAGGAPTQVEFDSRKVSWVRLDIPAGSTPASLREMAVFLAWGTAPTWIGGSTTADPTPTETTETTAPQTTDPTPTETTTPAQTEEPTPDPTPIEPSIVGVTAVASSSASGQGPAALIDATDSVAGATGNAWQATSSGAQWVEIRFDAPRTISAVDIFGSNDSAGTVSWGHLVFSDGSRVLTGGVIAGNAPPTTVAFPSRTVTSVRFEITGTRDGTPASLRELVAYDTGTVVPQYQGAAASTLLPEVSATAASACAVPTGTSSRSSLHLVCPDTGTTLTGSSSIVLAGPKNTTATVTAWTPASSGSSTGAVKTIGTVAIGANGYGSFTPASSRLATLMHGPLPLRFTLPNGTDLTAQFYNPGGVTTAAASASAATGGLHLVYDLDFRQPVSAARGGVNAVFSSNKPSSGGKGYEYGDAIFAEPSKGYGNLTLLEDEYLRMRTMPLPAGESDPMQWGRSLVGGMLASGGASGSGISAQYGYFEARMLAPDSTGTWPAFWLLSAGGLRVGYEEGPVDEVDVTEIYGTDSTKYCLGVHGWLTPGALSRIDCDGYSHLADVALSWHTYGARITEAGATFYLDGVKVSEMGPLPNDDQPFHFLVTMALGGGWPVDLSSTDGITDLYVDYVRVYT
ncbi:glycoside hydrolase family 16 protein [Demequina salsinemoris]|uniref:glycoside hydrolase family 16 protein n=1 Tax=Demequina salsinemoris TaxID=577470 RepID=UPI000780827D|nr:discoidin domain-containing protein [Demequina salsinemoris]